MTEKSGVGGEIDLPPGFRFFPTDEELVVHYLCKKVVSHPLPAFIIGEVDLYKYDPWQLPEKALFGEKEWYFFTPRDRKYPNGSRPNRAAGSGYWKATGADKPITTCGGRKRVGVKKALVFYKGKAPKGSKTNWIMHEYRMAEINMAARKMNTLRLDDWVLCRIYNKKSSAEKLEEKKLAEDRQEMEEAIEQQKNRQTVHLEAPRSEATVSAEGGVPSSSSSILISQLPAAMNLSPAPHNPFYHQQSTDINRSYSIGAETRSSLNPDSAATPLQYNRLNSTSMTERTKAMKPGLVTSAPNPDEVQTNLKLPNQLIQKQQTGQTFNFNLGLDGLQSPFFQMDHTEPPSLYNPYQEFIDSYNIQRSY